MTDPETILRAGKQIAATASGRALKDDGEDTAAETKRATKEGRSEPGNPNDLDHGDQQPGQEKANGS